MKIKMVHKDRNIKVTEENKRFFRKDKKLKAYAFYCWYVETYISTVEVDYHVSMASPPFWTKKPMVEVFIEKDGCYNVKMYQHNPALLGHFSRWESFDTLKEARKYCSSLLKEIQKIDVPY